jgi:CotH kinase protein
MFKGVRSVIAAAMAMTLLSSTAAYASPSVSGISTTEFNEGSDKAAVFYNPLAVSAIDLTFPAATYQELTVNPYTTVYQHASIKITTADGVQTTFADVGIRLKGQATRTNLSGKAPFKIKFDSFVPGQKFMGLTRMTLNSMVQDPSFIHEDTAYRIYRAMGIIAPRTTYSWVTVNGMDFGLYMNVETIDSQMLKRWTTPKHVYSSNCYVQDLTPDKSYCFDTNYGDSNRSDLQAAINVSQYDGETWWTEVNKIANMTQVINLMAVDIYTSNWDGYTDVVQNNYYIVFNDKGVLSLIPWGQDGAFPNDPAAQGWWDGVGPIFRNFSPQRSVMLRKCVAYAPCKLLLTKAQVAVKNKVTELNVIGFKNRVAALINNAYVAYETRANLNVASAIWWQNWLDTFFPQRNASLTAYLNTVRPDVPTVSISGSSGVGSTLIALGASWDYTSTIGYQWYRDNQAITGANSNTYQLRAEDETKNVWVQAIASKNNFPSAYANSATILVTSNRAASAAISGNAVVGSQLTATPINEPGIQVSYKWLRAGRPISGATNSSYVLTGLDFGKQISVTTTVNQNNYPITITTAPAVVVGAGTMDVTAVNIQSTAVMGQTVYSQISSDPGTKISYQWLRDGVAISSATRNSYVIKLEDISRQIQLKATFSKTGYNTVVINSVAVIPTNATFIKSPTPTITGTAKVTKIITANTGIWDSGARLSYQWFRNGVAITNATSKSYKITSADLNTQLTFTVTATKPGFNTLSQTSVSISVN